jgi:hypothetical protein
MLDITSLNADPQETARQLRLCTLNRLRFTPALPVEDWSSQRAEIVELESEENGFLEEARARVSDRAAEAPIDPNQFISWFETLQQNGPGQGDPLFPWLAESATFEQMRWFLAQEVAGEAGFDDLTALTQVKLPVRVKLELARNYWDEMGRGNLKAMHGPLLDLLAKFLDLRPAFATTITASVALANTMAGLAANRRFAYHSVGALGVIEMTAPGRSAAVAAGLKRLGVSSKKRHYFSLHAVLDVKHSLAWNAEAIFPLVSTDGRIARAIAEGALMRLDCGARCFERYREKFCQEGVTF